MRLRSYIRKIALILNRAELKKAVWLGIANTFVSIADIGFLAALLYVVHFYIGGNQHAGIVPPGGGSYFNRHPIVLIICFLGLFGVKNFLAYLCKFYTY